MIGAPSFSGGGLSLALLAATVALLSSGTDSRASPASSATTPWPQPPPVSQLPSIDGPNGPPVAPGTVAPSSGPEPRLTGPYVVHAQDRTLLKGPFPAGLARGVSDGTLAIDASPFQRARGLALVRATGAQVFRIPVDWASVAPWLTVHGRPSDPANPAYRFGRIDRAVRDAVTSGLRPLLVVSHAPAFAEAPRRWRFAYPGSWAPSPTALSDFALALASRYDGTFPDVMRAGQALPRVQLFQAWNEPNQPRYLEPQWIVSGHRWTAFSPIIYRALLNAFYLAVKSVRPDDVVIAAGLSPLGDRTGVGRMAPVSFLRSLLCLTAAGTLVAACPAATHFDILSFHPFSVGNPDQPARSALDVSIADAIKITAPLVRAERLGTALPAGPKGVWVTELNWESASSSTGVPSRLQAHYVSRALHRLWTAGVGLVDWHFLADPENLRLSTPTGGRMAVVKPAGLYRNAGAGLVAKPFLRGFTLPFDPVRYDRARVRLWALLLAPGQLVDVQALRRGAWREMARLRANRYSVLNRLITLREGARLRLVTSTETSASATVAGGLPSA